MPSSPQTAFFSAQRQKFENQGKLQLPSTRRGQIQEEEQEEREEGCLEESRRQQERRLFHFSKLPHFEHEFRQVCQ